MSNETPRYDEVRDMSVATYGDSRKMARRSPAVYAAGAQAAFDRLHSRLHDLPGVVTLDFVDYLTADLLVELRQEATK